MKIRIKTETIEWECEGEPVAYTEEDRYSHGRQRQVIDGDNNAPRETFHHQKGVVECHLLFLEFLSQMNQVPSAIETPATTPSA